MLSPGRFRRRRENEARRAKMTPGQRRAEDREREQEFRHLFLGLLLIAVVLGFGAWWQK